jgi:peptidyl-dipeptidase A
LSEQILSFLTEFESKVVELTKRGNIAYFDATISGNPKDYAKASEYQVELSKVYSDKELFNRLIKIMEDDDKTDPILTRQLQLIYNDFAMNQYDSDLHKEIIELSSVIEERFSVFRATVDDKELTDNEIDYALENETDNETLKKVWEASKQIGEEVYTDVIKLVKLRNKAAQSLGYENYHTMSLELSELDVETVDKLFDELYELTKLSFTSLKDEVDQKVSAKRGLDKNKLMPWHFEDKFFQLGPRIYNVNYDEYFKNEDVVNLSKKYFSGLGLDVNDILVNSDLYEKEKKYQHAYCTDIDRRGDIRIVCNVKPNQKWMSTMLHELGHAVYDKFISAKLPWQLRSHAHIFTTEAIAMLFGRLASNPNWIKDVVGIDEVEMEIIKEESNKSLRLEQLTFSRWSQLMYQFEKQLYANPDQDLNALWWKLAKKYQHINKPEGRDKPDWAAKIHIALYPAYYHNYQLGELLASQLNHYICKKVLNLNDIHNESFHNKKDVGEYLKHLFFSPGALYKWDELIVKSTGEPLTAKYYAQQFVGEEELQN